MSIEATSSDISTTEELLQAKKDYLWSAFKPNEFSATSQLILARGEDCIVTDIFGRSYIDAKSASLNASCGYNRREIIDAITQQMTSLMNGDSEMFDNIPSILLARKYAELFPLPLNRTYFCSSGSEAIEAAIKVARMYFALQGKPQKRKIVSLKNGYHGMTLAALSVSAMPFAQYGNEPLPQNFLSISPPVQFYGRTRAARKMVLSSPNELRELIEREGPDTVAAFLMEPIQGIGGIVIPPAGYIEGIRTICSQYNILFILDEILTGFGRTGKMFAFEHENVVADIVATSKGVTGGYVPLSTITTSDDIYATFGHDLLFGGFRHGHTNSAHATACAAALATIDVIEQNRLVENSARVGSQLLQWLQELLRFPFILDVRGKGLLIGIEINEGKYPGKIASLALHKGLIIRQHGPVLSIVPPLTLSLELAEKIATILQQACQSFSLLIDKR